MFWIGSPIEQQFDSPDPVALLKSTRQQHDYTKQFRGWWKITRGQPSDDLLRLLWAELQNATNVPGEIDLNALLKSWKAAHSTSLWTDTPPALPKTNLYLPLSS